MHVADRDHGHSHGQHAHHGHDHGTGLARAGERHRGRMLAAFVVIFAFFVVEAVFSFVTNSLALLADAGHMLTDVIGLGIALAAIQLASRWADRVGSQRSRHTFGLYRLEILAAAFNALLLLGVAVWVIVEAIRRFDAEPEILTTTMLVVAVAGLVANLIAMALLRSGADESLNVQGAYLEVLADTIGSVGVIVAALVMMWFGWTWVDPLIGAMIGVWIVPRTLKLGAQAVHVLLQAAPKHVDLDALAADLHDIDGVVDVHDLHVWTLTSEMEAASAHLVTTSEADAHAVLDRARELVSTTHGIDHGTFQVEPAEHEGCAEIAW